MVLPAMYLSGWLPFLQVEVSRFQLANGQLSQAKQVISGIPLGSVLGALLFLCYINDMPENIKSSIRLYADDALLYREIHFLEDSRILQEDINRL